MDSLFEQLRESGIDGRMGDHDTGGLGCANDITLIVPSQNGLQYLIYP